MISSEVSKVSYIGQDGMEKEFSFPFDVFSASDLRVVRADASQVIAEYALDVDFTADLINKKILLTLALPKDYTLTISRELPFLQMIDFENQGPIFLAVLEEAVDRCVMLAQQVQEMLSRTVRVPISESSAVTLPGITARKGKLLAFNATTGAPEAGPSASTLTDLTTAIDSVNAALADVEALADSFGDAYLGSKVADPSLDNDGNALLTGALYFNLGAGLKVWDGSSWVIAYAPSGNYLAKTGDTISGQLISSVVSGTAPFVVASTTEVANLNAAMLKSKTWAAPDAIGTGTPNTASFTRLFLPQTQNGLIYVGPNSELLAIPGVSIDAATGKLTAAGGFRMSGSASGYVEIVAPAAAASTTFTLPADDGAPGDAMVTNGAGVLSFARPGTVVDKVAAGSPVLNTTSETTVYLKTIPAGTLGVLNRINLVLAGAAVFGNDDYTGLLTVRVKFGGTLLAAILVNSTSSAVPLVWRLNVKLCAQNSATVQRCFAELVFGPSTYGIPQQLAAGSSAVNSAVNQDLLITAQFAALPSSGNNSLARETADLVVVA